MSVIAAAPPVPDPAATPVAPFSFDPSFETKIAALFLQDESFAKEAMHYLKVEHFSNALERNIVAIAMLFMKRFGTLPSAETFALLVKAEPKIAPAERVMYITSFITLALKTPVREREFIRQSVVEFCKNQALMLLALRTPDLLSKGEPEKIQAEYTRIFSMGQVSSAQYIDFFAEAKEREAKRAAMASGSIIMGVSTGFPEIDACLYRKGWGRGELTVIMAPSKRGKTAFMLQSGIYSAITTGSNVLFISLEVSEDILSDRADAMITGTIMGDLLLNRTTIADSVTSVGATSGKFYIERRSSNSMTTGQIDDLLDQYRSKGIRLDMVVVDYIGILRLDDPKDRFNGLGIAAKELRRISDKYNVALVTGAQTNRDAVGKTVAGMDSIGESFAIVQDCDLLISINATDAELASGVRRIYFAASRNGADATIKVHGDLEKMQLIQSILGIEK